MTTPLELLDTFRSEMNDDEEPFLWSDDEAYSYFDDAQKMFCRLTDGISDATTRRVTTIAFAVDAEWVKLDASIKKIRTAYLVPTGAPVLVINQEDMPGMNIRFDGRVGPVAVLILGMEENKARVYPKAASAGTIQLSVFRLPLIPIDGGASPFEIAEHHHRHLLLWAKSLAYAKQDSQTMDTTKAQVFEDKFRTYCAKAVLEQQDKRHKVRVVAYGGI